MKANSITDRERLRFALLFTVIFILIIWGVYLLDHVYELGLNRWGNKPKDPKGLIGILTYPLLHDYDELNHILNNTASFFTLNFLLFYFYRSISLRVWLILYLVSGALLWGIGELGSNHIGASGIIYGIASFLFFSGVIRKNLLLLRVSLVVVFLYGGMIWWVLPLKDGISWEGHLAGALTGLALAFLFRNSGPKRPIYKYEISEAAHEDLPEWWMRGNPDHPDTIAQIARMEREKLEKEKEIQNNWTSNSTL